MRFILGVCLVTFLIAGPVAHADPSVVGDDEHDRYVASGGLLLPGSMSTQVRDDAYTCLDCAWRLTWACAAYGTDDCGSVVQTCPVGTEWVRLWVRRPGTDWRVVTTFCHRPGDLVPRADIEDALNDRVARLVPPLRPGADPESSALLRLPVVFRSGQAGTLGPVQLSLLGRIIGLEARATWTWHFGDGSHHTTARPGGPWPNAAIAHAYREPGDYRATVTAQWRARYTIDGRGPFPVLEQVRQDSGLIVRVREARALLIG
jgi:hypothetical protein